VGSENSGKKVKIEISLILYNLFYFKILHLRLEFNPLKSTFHSSSELFLKIFLIHHPIHIFPHCLFVFSKSECGIGSHSLVTNFLGPGSMIGKGR
jgi:hypothetical protein